MATKKSKAKKSDELLSVTVSYMTAHRFGMLFGSLLSVAVVFSKQTLLTSLHVTDWKFWALSLVVAGGLVYSALTVYHVALTLTNHKAKSIGLVVLFEGVAVLIPIQHFWQHGNMAAFVIGMLFVTLATGCLAAINGYAMAANCVTRYVERSERVAWAAHKKTTNMAKLEAKKEKFRTETVKA
jgi:hypothetical protein